MGAKIHSLETNPSLTEQEKRLIQLVNSQAMDEEEENFSKPKTNYLAQNKVKSFDEAKETESSSSKLREEYEKRLMYEFSQAFSQCDMPFNTLPPTSTLNALSQALEKRQMFPEYFTNPIHEEEDEDPFRMMARAEHMFHKDSSIPLTDIEEVAEDPQRDEYQRHVLEEVQTPIAKPSKKRISSKRMKEEKPEKTSTKVSKKELERKEKSPSEPKSKSKKPTSTSKGKGQTTIDSFFRKPTIVTSDSPLMQQQRPRSPEPLHKNFPGKESSRRPYMSSVGYGVTSTSCNYSFPPKENHLPLKTITFFDP